MTELADFRAAKDTFFRSHAQSPLTPEQRRDFEGLNYFPENPSFVFALEPQPFEEPELVELQTSTGDSARYLRWARVSFDVDGSRQALTLYRNDHAGDIFLPFTDAGRGADTYGAGRYLDVEETDDGRVLLDFNYAYNPYCAYNDSWSCPLPPSENRLTAHIRAGEKLFHEE